MADTTRFQWFQDHGKVLVPVAAVLFVVGLAVGAAGVTTALGANDDLTTAEDDLQRAEEQRDEAAAEADDTAARLEETQVGAASTHTAAEAVAADGRELCNCDDQASTLAPQALQALIAGNAGEFNRITDEMESWGDQHNTLADQISENLPDVVRVGD